MHCQARHALALRCVQQALEALNSLRGPGVVDPSITLKRAYPGAVVQHRFAARGGAQVTHRLCHGVSQISTENGSTGRL